MQSSIAKRAKRSSDAESRERRIALAMCNAERKHWVLPEIADWHDLTEDAQEHYMRLARAALTIIE